MDKNRLLASWGVAGLSILCQDTYDLRDDTYRGPVPFRFLAQFGGITYSPTVNQQKILP